MPRHAYGQPLLFLLQALALLLSLAVAANAFTLRTWDEAYALATTAVANLTLPEKVGLLSGLGQGGSRCVGDTTGVARLGIPALCMNDGPAGVRLVKNVTGFPAGINAAATFSRRLMQARGQAMAEEFRGKGIHILLGPAMDLMRNPKAGRAWESFGPDPYLTGEGAFYTVTGIQSVGVQACAKHLAANNQEHWRYGLSAIVDDRTMHEMYFYPFLRAIEAGVTSIMCAYNQQNGTSSCHNAGLLGDNGIVRKAGFRGFLMSDWGATHDSVADNANAGLDMEQPGSWILIGGGVFGVKGTNLANAVNGGRVSLARVNQMATRVLAAFYKLGQDSGYPPVNFDAQKPDGSGSLNLGVSVRSAAHTALVREIGAASAVLLKNNRTTAGRGLPLAKDRVKSMAIVGLDAAYPNLSCGDLNECNDDEYWMGLRLKLTCLYRPAHQGDPGLCRHIRDAARGKDVCLVFGNAMSGELGFYNVVVGNMGDRNDLNLWWKGGSLIERVASVCSNTIAVIHSVGPVSFSWSNHPNITAIVYAGAPGEQTGPSLVDVLYGAVNPSGRLPFSIDENEASYGTEIVYNSLGFPVVNYTEQLLLDYRYMDAKNITPHYEFGFGLSYTTFAYSALRISATNTQASVSFVVTNTGAVVGTEIAQLYLAYPASAGEPKRVLRGFEEVRLLGVGESRAVTIVIGAREMSIWDVVTQAWVRPAGTFTVTVGASIRDLRLTGTF
ncbi:putative beta-glucosidase L [Mycena kentingensis (nom. inval.)]|nr:putative beta-glucosidase L [Mycena kentingensis (nom. inval.)]KAF7327057.1 putative beta-glucosidase L [Mycena kentingensis (nom. inval.)]